MSLQVAGAVGLMPDSAEESTAPDQGHIQNTANNTTNALELVLDHGSTVIRFPSVDLLVDFLRKSA